MGDLDKQDQVLKTPFSLPGNPHNNSLLKTKLRLEAELESRQDQFLAEDLTSEHRQQLLLTKAEQQKQQEKRTLQFYTDMNAALGTKVASLDVTLQRSQHIKEALSLEQQNTTQHDQIAAINDREKQISPIFQAFRKVFRDVLDSTDKKSPDLNVAEVLQELTQTLLEQTSDPYREMDDLNCDAATLRFLICHNLVQRHSHYSTKIKLLDPRK